MSNVTHSLKAALLATALAVSAGVAQAAPIITTYTTEAAFIAGVPGSTLETFASLIAPGRNDVAGTYDYGPFSITKEYTGGSTGSQAGNWRGRPSGTLADVIAFDQALLAWGAFFNTQEGGNGTGIRLTVEFLSGNVVIGSVGAGADPNNGFLGFRSDTAFDTVRLTSVPSGNDTYLLDNMRYKVPEPASAAVLGAGLAALGIAMRRRRVRY